MEAVVKQQLIPISFSNMYQVLTNPQFKWSVLILGQPGIGKSSLVEQAARDLAKQMGKKFVKLRIIANANFRVDEKKKLEGVQIEDHSTIFDKDSEVMFTSFDEFLNAIETNLEDYYIFVDLRLVTVEPVDLSGIPDLSKVFFVYKPSIWAYALSKCSGTLFLDELTAVQREDVLSAAFQLVLDRIAGLFAFRPDVKVVAAGNTPDQSSVANEIPTPLADRFAIYVLKPPTVEEWIDYMDKKYGDKWDRTVASFLLLNKEYFIEAPNVPRTLIPFPTPRSWDALATTLTVIDTSNIELTECTVQAFVGLKAGIKYMAFRKILSKIDVEKYLKNPQDVNNLKADEKLALVQLLAKRLYESDVNELNNLIDSVCEIMQTMTFDGNRIGYEHILLLFISLPKDNKGELIRARLALKLRLTELGNSIHNVLELVKVLKRYCRC